MKRFLIIPAIALFSLLIACSDDDNANPSDATATTASSADQTPAPEEQPQGLQFVLDSVGGDIDIEELRRHLAPELQQMSDEELSEVNLCFPSDVNAEVLDQQVENDGGTATLTVSWKVTEDAASSIETTVDRTWRFEQITEGEQPAYEITGLPTECPFEPADTDGTQEPAIETPTP